MNKVRLVNTFLALAKLSSPSGGEGLVQEYVVRELQKLGIKAMRDAAGNIYGRAGGAGEPVLLSAHLDTVGPCENVSPQVRREWITSDGTTILGADNKAAVAAILETLRSTSAAERKPIEVIFSVKEETAGGINSFDTKQVKSKIGLVADSELPVGNIILSAPAIADFAVIFQGKSTHTSTPHRGNNALSAAALAIGRMKWGKISQTATSNIGIIQGGTDTNTIPEKIEVKGEVRSFKNGELEIILKKMKKAFRAEAGKHKVNVVFDIFPYCAAYKSSKKSLAITSAIKAIEEAKLPVYFKNSFGASDANYLNEKGIEVVNIGDGAENIHTTKERISVKSLQNLTQVFTNYVKI